MKNQSARQAVHKPETNKLVSVVLLSAMAIAIILMGGSFAAYSFVNNVSLKVLSSNVHGSVFGVIITFLGVRYLLAVNKLKAELYSDSAKFSWRNFRKSGASKAASKIR